MKNNVYVRSHRSIKNISLVRIGLLVPLIIYGFYKNGIYLFVNKYATVLGMFKPLLFIIIGGLIGAIINLFYEFVIKKNRSKLIDLLFSSFHIEYGMLLGCVTSLNTNILLFSVTTFALLFISKFIRKRVNVMAIVFIIIYVLQMYLFKEYSFANNYETSRAFSLDFMDYMVGRGTGGIASTHIILLIVSMLGISVSNNNKSYITISSIVTAILLFGAYSIVSKNTLGALLLTNNILFVYTYIATDYITSSYTATGGVIFGILVGVLTFGFYFINPILSPFIAVAVVSLFNRLIDKIANRLNKSYV